MDISLLRGDQLRRAKGSRKDCMKEDELELVFNTFMRLTDAG